MVDNSDKIYTTEDGIKLLRDQRNVPHTPGCLLYTCFGNADPAVLEKIENQCGDIIASALNVGAFFRKAEKDPILQKQLRAEMQRVINIRQSNESDTSEE